MDYFNYKLTIVGTPYYYSGSSKPYKTGKGRICNHKSSCFNKKYASTKLYAKILELGVTKKDFYDRVILTKILTGISKEQALKVENSLINLADPFCLNSKESKLPDIDEVTLCITCPNCKTLIKKTFKD